MVKEGVINPEKLKGMRISKDQIFSILRSQGVRHLGEVKRLYSEADSHFSLFKFKETRLGLSVFPRSDKGRPSEEEKKQHEQACCQCGNVIEKADDYPQPCGNCGNREWMAAMQ